MAPSSPCPSCGCTVPANARCQSCRRPPGRSGSMPEHLFSPPTLLGPAESGRAAAADR